MVKTLYSILHRSLDLTSTARKKVINKEVDELTLKLRDYYKKEWEKVKAGL